MGKTLQYSGSIGRYGIDRTGAMDLFMHPGRCKGLVSINLTKDVVSDLTNELNIPQSEDASMHVATKCKVTVVIQS